MSTIMDNKKLEQAIKWIDESLQAGKNLSQLLQEVGMRFNLGPKETAFLERFFKSNSKDMQTK